LFQHELLTVAAVVNLLKRSVILLSTRRDKIKQTEAKIDKYKTNNALLRI
jgi:hypothetical protein